MTPREISVLSWNTEHYGFERRPQGERDELERNMFALIRAADPDIFLIQETYGSFHAAVLVRFAVAECAPDPAVETL